MCASDILSASEPGEGAHEHPPGAKPWRVAVEYCASDAFHPAWERRYDDAGIGFVVSGWFDYRASIGAVTGVPGTVVFGNSGEHYDVRHLDSIGNRRLVIWFGRDFLEQVAEAHGFCEARFRVVALPPGKVASNMFAHLQTLLRRWEEGEEAASALAGIALGIGSARAGAPTVAGRDRQRILAAIRHIENAYFESCTVETLAAVSGLSRYHFMRLFRAVVGQSANQYVINTRLRAAAERLIETATPISEIAFDVGFNDISHFNTCFRAVFECTPRQMRGGARPH